MEIILIHPGSYVSRKFVDLSSKLIESKPISISEAVFTKPPASPMLGQAPKMSLRVLFVLVLMKLRQKLILLRREGDHCRQIAYIAFV